MEQQTFFFKYYFLIGTWLSLVEHSVRDAGVGGSNPLVPIKSIHVIIIHIHSNKSLSEKKEGLLFSNRGKKNENINNWWCRIYWISPC